MRRPSSLPLVPLLVSALVLNPLAGVALGANRAADAEPTFAELVENKKEAESILLKGEDLTEAENYYPAEDAKVQAALSAAFGALAASFEPKEGEPTREACEPLVLSRLQTEVAARGLPADPTALRFALLRLREKNLLDDVALLPLLAAYPAWTETGYDEKEWLKKDEEGRVAVLDCPTEQYLQVYAATKVAKGRKLKAKHVRKRIDELAKEEVEVEAKVPGQPNTKKLRFLPVQIEWLRALEATAFQREAEFALAPILREVAEAKNSSPRADPNDPPTKVMSKKKKKTGGLSNRLALYAKYNGMQINMLADLFRTFTERMDVLSAEAKIVIRYKDGRPDEVYELSQQEQYRMAAKMLHKEIEELKLSGLFSGKAPTFDDVIVASVETGFVHAAELDAAMGVDDLWNPKVSGWQKVMTVVKKYGSVALVLIPNPYTFWASLGITLVETLVKKKTQGAGEADDHGISIF